MRTRFDLDDAFALLEQQADDYATATSDAPAAPLELTAAGVDRPRSRRVATGVAAAVLAAAAVVVTALAIGVGTGGDGNDAAGQGPTLNDGPAARTIPVTVDPALKMRILEVTATADSTSVELYNRTAHAELTLFSRHSKVVSPGLQRVDVNGRTGYYDDGTRSPFVEQPGDPSTQGPVATPTPPDTLYARAVIFEYRPHAWALVVFQGRVGTKTGLLRVARATHVGGTQPLRSVVSLSAAPSGMHLAYLDATYRGAGDNPPFDLTGGDWDTLLNYLPTGTGHGIHVEATSYDLTQGWRGGQPTTLEGHRAYWFPTRNELDVDLGNGAYMDVSEVNEAGDGKSLTMTRARIVAVTRTITLTAHPTRPGTWFDARTALP